MLTVLPGFPPQNVLLLRGIRRTRNEPRLHRVRSPAVSAGLRPERKGQTGMGADTQRQIQWFWAGAQELIVFINAPRETLIQLLLRSHFEPLLPKRDEGMWLSNHPMPYRDRLHPRPRGTPVLAGKHRSTSNTRAHAHTRLTNSSRASDAERGAGLSLEQVAVFTPRTESTVSALRAHSAASPPLRNGRQGIFLPLISFR